MKNRIGAACATFILVAIMIFLAVDVGFSLYSPDRLAVAVPVCTLNIISGDVSVQTSHSVSWEKAEDGMELEPGSRVRTSPGAHAMLTFSEGTTTTLEPSTDIIVAKLEGNMEKQPDAVALEQRAGKTWNRVAARPDNGDYFQIETSSADVKVHGTLFATEVDGAGNTLVQTSEGRVSVKAQGKEVQVCAGEQTEVEADAAPLAPVPIPPARSELVFTVGKPAIGLVIDPSGSRTGYLPEGSSLNQISGSRLTPSGEPYHNIRIPEPETGEYTVVLHGVEDGTSSLGIEGFAGGTRTFTHAASCNITAANDLVLKLHLDVLDGLLQGVEVLSLESSGGQPTVITTTLKTTPKPAEPDVLKQGTPDNIAASKNEETSKQGIKWERQDGASKYVQRIVITGIVIILAVISAVVWRKR